jgi:hypothetical protein
MATLRAKWMNAALLIGGYAVGQGSIFAVQTLLLASDRLDLLAAFGTAFSFAILGSLLIDFGGLTALARETARAEGRAERIWRHYWAVTACRLMVAAVVVVAVAGYAALAGDAFLAAYALWALPAAVIWALNAAGMLDGLRLGGVNGVVGAAPYLSSAVALVVAMHVSPGVGGALLGGALSGGYAVALIGQYVALRRAGHAPRFVRPTVVEVATAGREAGAVLLGTLPGQLYFRYQLLLANIVLGPAGTALFVYAKQIATAAAQVVGFLRRVEFPDLVLRLAEARGDAVRVALEAQRAGTRLGAAAAAVMIIAGLAGHFWLPGPLGDAATAVAMFGPTVLAGAFSTTLLQALLASRRYAAAAAIMATSVGAGVAIGTLAFASPTLAVFVLADLAVYVVTFLLSRAALLGYRPMVGEPAA